MRDASGLAIAKAPVTLQSEGNQYSNSLVTDDAGQLDVSRLAFGEYQISILQPGFAPFSETVEIRSQLPTDVTAALQVASETTRVEVNANDTLINPDQAGSANEIGASGIKLRVSSLPGRSIQD
ncbi:MAG: carboxypeptidase-like regulatory domain-containing protein, partial [Candidatus Acidiferrales bacterium]